MKVQNKPELLLPAGNIESFYAAIEGGADAVYLGAKDFNARNRAANFTWNQLISLTEIALEKKVKVYITLNTVIKNSELEALTDTLWVLSQLNIYAVIIQDWGVYYLLKKFFPNLIVHASTQMANHNSLGAEYSEIMDFERVILARELTLKELSTIKKKNKIEVETFIHGALCYSFSGMCLFSSFLGGAGANRGMCTQPCRRNFTAENHRDFIFSLKDFQLIDHVQELSKIGIASLKIEGRMKSADYVYRVAKAYRMAIDNPKMVNEAKELLELDFGREKTDYFVGKEVGKAITTNPNTGFYLGKVSHVTPDSIQFESNMELNKGNRLRIRNSIGDEQLSCKLNDFTQQENKYILTTDNKNVRIGDKVFLANMADKKFPNKFEPSKFKKLKLRAPGSLRQKIFKEFKPVPVTKKQTILSRIDSLSWLRKIHMDEIDGLILNLSKKEWQEFNPDLPFLKKNRFKIYIELPKFIAEQQIEFYTELCKKMTNKGYKNFFISHLSQLLIIPEEATVCANENVYVYNDATAKLLKQQQIANFTYPLEDDFENLSSHSNKNGFISMFYNPHLFYSRMPVKVNSEDQNFKDDKGDHFIKTVKDGITIVIPQHPVSLTQYKKQLQSEGFHNFIVDFSFIKPSKNLFQKVLKRLKASEQIQPSNNFNFKIGLK